MNAKRITSLLTFVACGVAAACTGDAATPSQPLTPHSAARSVGTNHFTVPFTFEMPAGTCGLTTTVHGSGDYEFVESNRVGTPNGTRTIAISNVHAHGTAWGDDGTRYTFSYVNNGRWLDVPPAPLSITFVDNFHLSSRGSGPNVGITVQGNFSVDVNGNETFSLQQRHGDFSCDPI
jgi:hypothetical protein